MELDIKGKIEELAKKVQKDPKLMEKFQKEPVATIEGLLGVDLPDDQLKPLVAGVQAKLAATNIGDKLGGLKGLLG